VHEYDLQAMNGAGAAEPRRLCTIAARNYAPSIALLVRTFATHHPDIPVTVLVVDATQDGWLPDCLTDSPCEVVTPDALSMSREAFLRMATYYDVTELSTALKPFLLRHLLEHDCERVMYLDPDIEVYAPLDELFRAAEQHQIALTPHVLHPMPRDGLNIGEETIMSSGQFNLGFICVSRKADAFLDYWSERTRLYALAEQGHQYFTDQRWVDAVPALFDHIVCRNPAYNVAHWNLHERVLDVDESGCWTVDGAPLGFFHFSGHDASEPTRLSKFVVPPERVRVEQHPALERMLRERSARVVALTPEHGLPPYGWKRTASGLDLTRAVRRTYWDAVRDAEAAGRLPPSHAFDDEGGRALTDWLLEPATPGSVVSRFLYALWCEHAHLQRVIQDPLGADGEHFVDTAREDPTILGLTPLALRPPPRPPKGGLPGVNLVGCLEGETGVAAVGRMLARMVGSAGLSIATSSPCPPEHGSRLRDPATISGAPFRLSVFAMSSGDLLRFANRPELSDHADRKRAGSWSWEVGGLPEWMLPAFDLVDEVWCASEHVRSLLLPNADKPVLKHPLMITPPSRAPSLNRSDLGITLEGFLFGFVFDFRSVARKNPLGLIDAYLRGFSPSDGCGLVLKSVNSASAPEQAAAVEAAVEARPDVQLLDRPFSEAEMRAFFHRVDCYTSLHRSEGLGVSIAMAMAAGTPAIATGWSGNMEFMTPDESLLVPCSLVAVGPDAAPYAEDAPWADPDLDAAAEAMRRVVDTPGLPDSLGEKARRRIAAVGEAATSAQWFVDRFEALTGIEAGLR